MRKKIPQTENSDLYQTPPHALIPLIPFLKEQWTVWECACGEDKIGKYLRKEGYTVVSTDILSGKNFLKYEPQDWDCIVTNPPYSLKYEFLRRCYALDKPFALLMPLTTLETKKRQALFKEYGLQIILLDKRINFMLPNNVKPSSGSWFPVAWFTNKLNLPSDMIFRSVDGKQEKLR